MTDPNKFINDVKKILSNDGILLLEFADLASIIEYKMFDTICHEHLEYYSTKVIINLCKKNNLRVFDIKKNEINGASKQFFICHENSKFLDNQRNINKILKTERKLKLNEEKTYKKFLKDINKSKINLVSFLKKIRKAGKKVHGYGASTKGNVLLQYYGINNKLIECVAERKQKQVQSIHAWN